MTNKPIIPFLVVLIVTYVILMTSSMELRAQDKLEPADEGEIKDVQVEILKDRKVSVPPAQRAFKKIPPQPFQHIIPPVDYNITNFKVSTGEYIPKIRILKIKNEEIDKLYGNYLSAGFGNYASYFGEGSFSSKRSKNRLLGVHGYTRAFVNGPVDGKNSGASNTDINLFGKRMGSVCTIVGRGNWNYRSANFYGYRPQPPPADKNAIRQTYNEFNVNGMIYNSVNGDFNFNAQLNYTLIMDRYSAYEGDAFVKFNSDIAINETSKVLILADYSFMNRKDVSIPEFNRHLIRLNSGYYFSPIDKINVLAGFNIAVVDDKYDKSKKVHFYPEIKVNADINASLRVFFEVTGNIDKVNLQTIANENIWVDTNAKILNTNRALEIIGGFKGKIGSKTSLKTGMSYTKFNQLYFYNLTDQNKFNLIYDGNTKRTNPYVSITYSLNQIGEFILRGDYYFYNAKDLTNVWHRPAYRLTLDAKYFFYKKILLTSSFVAQGGIKALNKDNETVNLNTALDLNIKGRYFLSSKTSFFLELNNIFNNKYQIFLGYPVRGFQITGGFSWSF